MRIVLAILMMAFLTLTADAQAMRKHRNAQTTQSEEQKKKLRDADKAYKSSLQTIPNQKYDPWAKIRQ